MENKNIEIKVCPWKIVADKDAKKPKVFLDKNLTFEEGSKCYGCEGGDMSCPEYVNFLAWGERKNGKK